MPGTRIDFPKAGTANRSDGTSTGTAMHELLEGKNNRSSSKVFSCVAAFIDGSIECKKTAAMMRVHTRDSEIIADATGEMRQQSGGEGDLSSPEAGL